MKRLLTIILVILLLPSASLGGSFADMLEKAENYKTGSDYEKTIASFLFSQKLTPNMKKLSWEKPIYGF